MTNRTVIPLLPADLDSIAEPGRGRRAPGDEYRHWHAFTAHCRSLAKDGLQYRVTLQPFAARPHILIEASGIIGKRRRESRSNGLPELLTEARAQRGLEVALKDMADWKRNLAAKWGWWRERGYHCQADVAERKRSRRFGHWLGSRLALRPRGYREPDSFTPNLSDYKSADQAFGRKTPWVSQLSKSERECSGWVKAIAGRLGVHWGWRTPRTEPDLEPVPLHPDDETPRLARADWVERFLARQKPASYLDVSELTEYRRASMEVEYWREILRLLGERGRKSAEAR